MSKIKPLTAQDLISAPDNIDVILSNINTSLLIAAMDNNKTMSTMVAPLRYHTKLMDMYEALGFSMRSATTCDTLIFSWNKEEIKKDFTVGDTVVDEDNVRFGITSMVQHDGFVYYFVKKIETDSDGFSYVKRAMIKEEFYQNFKHVKSEPRRNEIYEYCDKEKCFYFRVVKVQPEKVVYENIHGNEDLIHFSRDTFEKTFTKVKVFMGEKYFIKPVLETAENHNLTDVSIFTIEFISCSDFEHEITVILKDEADGTELKITLTQLLIMFTKVKN